MTFTPRAFQKPAPRIEQADVPLATLRERMAALVERQRQDAAVERLQLILAAQPHQHATAGELAEQRHWLYDADPDSTEPPFPYPNALEAS
jgi:hypothetical protein